MSDMNHLEVTSALYEVGTAAALAVAAAAAAAPNEQAKVGDVAANLGPEGGEEVEGEEEEGEEEEEGDAGEVLPATVTQPVSELPVAQHSPVGRIPKKTKKPDSPSADDMNSGGELNGNTNTNNSNGTDGDDKDDDDDEAQLWYEDKSGGSEEKNISVIPGTGASGTEAVPFQNAFIGGIGGGGGVSGDDDDDDDSEFKLPHGVQLPATIPVDLISEKIGRMLYQVS